MQKIKIGLFSAGFISISRDFMPYFHFRCVARATFDRNLIHSADACFLVMACVGYSRAQLRTLSSLLEEARKGLSCRGNRYEVISALKVLPNNRVANIFIVCLHYEISFFGIFHRFTNTIATKKTLSSLLKRARTENSCCAEVQTQRERWRLLLMGSC